MSLFSNTASSNILLLKKAPYSMSFIDIFASSFKDTTDLFIPGNMSSIKFVDARTRNIFLLGHAFYFICFGEYLEKDKHYMVREELDKKENKNYYYKIDVEIIKLIRMMLNFSPVDRPSLEVILETLENLIKDNYYFKERMILKIRKKYLKMKNEVDFEYFSVETNNINKDETETESKQEKKKENNFNLLNFENFE